VVIASDQKHAPGVPAGQFAAQRVRFSDGRAPMVGKGLEELSGVALLHQEFYRQLTFGPAHVGWAAKQRNGCIAKPSQLGAREHSLAPKIPAQHQDKIGFLGWLGVNQETAQRGQGCLPADGQDRRRDQQSRQEHLTKGERKARPAAAVQAKPAAAIHRRPAPAQGSSTPPARLAISSLSLSEERIKMEQGLS
jgi:hypothetical protein